MEPTTEPDDATRASDTADGAAGHDADRPATDDEVAAAEEAYSERDPEVRQDVAQHEREMMQLGANVKGEGEIE